MGPEYSNVTNQKSILMVSQSSHAGGAAIATNRIFSCLKKGGFTVGWIVADKSENDNPGIMEIKKARKVLASFYSKIDWRLCKIINPGNLELQTSGFFGTLKSGKLNSTNFDLINIHWMGHGLISLRQLNKIKKPMVLTMHDEWFLHPISHYKENAHTSSRNKGMKQFLSNRIRKNRINLKLKIVNKDRVYIICPSEQLALKFRLQFPKKYEKIFFVPNPVDLTEFYPQKNAKYLNLSAESLEYPVAFYLGGTRNIRKGWDLLEGALDLIEIPFIMLIIGDSSRKYYGKFHQIEVINFKKVYGVENLRNLYSLSHFVIVPSREEAGGPQTATEALSCGTPVVGFKSGTMESIIRSGITGELGNSLNSTDLSHAIMKVIMNKKVTYEKNCRLMAKECFSFDKVLNEYILLFNSIIIN